MIPALLIRAVPYLLVVALVVATHGTAYYFGAANTATEYELQISQQAEQHQQAIAAEMAERLRTEQAAATELHALTERHLEAEKNAQADFDKRVADLRSQRVRVTIPVVSCRPVAANSGATGGAGAETRAELTGEAAADLEGIAADGDAAIRQLNKVIDAYNAVRARMNSR